MLTLSFSIQSMNTVTREFKAPKNDVSVSEYGKKKIDFSLFFSWPHTLREKLLI